MKKLIKKSISAFIEILYNTYTFLMNNTSIFELSFILIMLAYFYIGCQNPIAAVIWFGVYICIKIILCYFNYKFSFLVEVIKKGGDLNRKKFKDLNYELRNNHNSYKQDLKFIKETLKANNSLNSFKYILDEESINLYKMHILKLDKEDKQYLERYLSSVFKQLLNNILLVNNSDSIHQDLWTSGDSVTKLSYTNDSTFYEGEVRPNEADGCFEGKLYINQSNDDGGVNELHPLVFRSYSKEKVQRMIELQIGLQ